MNDIASDRVGQMQNPPHLGELIRESMDDVGWNVTETAARLGCERGTLSRLLNGKAGVSANMALALEDIGWGTAEHWVRMQASYWSCLNSVVPFGHCAGRDARFRKRICRTRWSACARW